MRTSEESARDAREGRITFEQFVRETRTKWRARAQAFARAFRLPTWLTVDDIEQELLLEAWHSLPGYEDGRGAVGVWSFVSFCAIKKTTKIVQGARGVEKHRRKGPARFEAPISSLAKAGDEDAPEIEVAVEPDQERVLEERANLRRVFEMLDEHGCADMFHAFAEARDANDAADTIYDDVRSRLRHRFSSREQARTVVRGVVRAMANSEVQP
jgi:hypothetical protein